jgi:hypothetical protein
MTKKAFPVKRRDNPKNKPSGMKNGKELGKTTCMC